MVVSIKDCLKFIAIAVVACCAAFVCSMFLNFYLDVVSLRDSVTGEGMLALYDAQVSMAKFVIIISGCCLALIAVIMLVYYVKLYIDGHMRQLGILKALGYSDGEICIRFWVFGLVVLLGTAVGFGLAFAFMPLVYKEMTFGMFADSVKISFHPTILVYFVVIPTVVFAGLACLYAFVSLKRPVLDMIKGAGKSKLKFRKSKDKKQHSFLWDMTLSTLRGKISLAVFIALAGFCFSAMTQMAFSMKNLDTGDIMNMMILVIGLVLAFTLFVLAVTSLIKSNEKNVSLMKSMGYNFWECSNCVIGGYRPFAYLGFAVGTVYQYILLLLMINLLFKDIVEKYTFDVPVFFCTLAAFIVLYEAATLLYSYKMSKISVKNVMLET